MDTVFTLNMLPDERELFIQFIPQGGSAVEFGCGESSRLFFEYGVESLVSIDINSWRLESLAIDPYLQPLRMAGRWLPLHADIGETTNKTDDGGVLLSPSLHWLNYHQYIWHQAPPSPADMYLVSNMFRVATVLQILIRWFAYWPVFVMHDFWNKEQYHILLEFLDVLESAETLVAAQPKEYIDWRNVAIVLQEYQFIVE